MEEIMIWIEDGIILGVYSGIKEPLTVNIIDSDDVYDDERKEKYQSIKRHIDEGLKNGTLKDILNP